MSTPGQVRKAVILAGGAGTRLAEETQIKPKPMVEIGGRPMLWHIMKIYAAFGIQEFIVCVGYRGYMIKEYFANYFLHMSDITFDIEQNTMQVLEKHAEPWRVTVIDTGDSTMTGGRLKRVQRYVGEETFCFTYGDGVSDLNINDLIDFHRKAGARATITAVLPPGRFGAMQLEGDRVAHFQEKPQGDGTFINGGFFVLEPSVFDLIEDDDTVWEEQPLQGLATNGELAAYRHRGFWHAMDTLRDRRQLEEMWQSGTPAWKVWS